VRFGSRYVGSPGITPGRTTTDGTATGGTATGGAITRIDEYHPSPVPGARFPHAWLPGGRSVFDLLGREFTLRFLCSATNRHEQSAARPRGET
jgi:hypothetical protein